MRAIWHFTRQLQAFAGAALYANLLGMVAVSFLEGIGIFMLVPMLGMAGVEGIGARSVPLAGLFSPLGSLPEAWRLPAALAAFFLIVAGQNVLKRSVMLRNADIHQTFVHRLTQETYRSLLQANWLFFAGRRRSDFLNTLTTELSRVSAGIGQLLQLAVSVVFMLIQIAIAFWLSPVLTAFVLACGSAIAYAMRHSVRKAKSLGNRSAELSKTYMAGLTDQLNGIKEIKINALERSRLDWLAEMSERRRREGNAFMRLKTVSQMYYQIGFAALVAAFAFFSIRLFHAGMAELLLIMLIFSRLWPRFTGLQSALEQIAGTMSAFQSVIHLQRETRAAQEITIDAEAGAATGRGAGSADSAGLMAGSMNGAGSAGSAVGSEYGAGSAGSAVGTVAGSAADLVSVSSAGSTGLMVGPVNGAGSAGSAVGTVAGSAADLVSVSSAGSTGLMAGPVNGAGSAGSAVGTMAGSAGLMAGSVNGAGSAGSAVGTVAGSAGSAVGSAGAACSGPDSDSAALAAPCAAPPILHRCLECRDVYFRYDQSKPEYALRNIHLHIPAGRMTAIVGRSGAGKSTLVDILMGLVEPESGEVLFDGEPLTAQNRQNFRRTVGYVPQDPFLFNGSVRDNLLLVNPSATDGELWVALAFSASDAFVRQLPQGLDTLIGDRGIRLSGGERQRLVLARSFLRKPSILVLDEATSALDAENESKIQEAVDALKGKLTLIVIAHRLTTIRNADQVIVVDEGRVVQQGGFQQLAQDQNNLFGQLFAKQPEVLVQAAAE